MPNRPEIRKRNERTISGGADVTRILAEVKALDQITEKLTPIRMERMSTGKTSRNAEKEVVPKLNVLYPGDELRIRLGIRRNPS